MTERIINVARDFTPYPAGRFRKHGRFTGQVFREDLLVPALRDFDVVLVDFNGTEGVRSSFLDEAFGGLVRTENLPREIVARLKVQVDDRHTALEIDEYIQKETDARRGANPAR